MQRKMGKIQHISHIQYYTDKEILVSCFKPKWIDKVLLLCDGLCYIKVSVNNAINFAIFLLMSHNLF